MIERILGAAAAASLLLLGVANVAMADIIVTCDGRVLPKKYQDKVKIEEGPTDAILYDSRKQKAELAYDLVKIGGQTISASEVCDIYITDAYENEHFRNGENQARSAYWPEAADSFGQAAEALKDAAKQVSLYKRVICLAETRDPDQTFTAAQELLDAFPKSYWFAPVQLLRARILINRGDKKGAQEMLQKVVQAPGMNARDYFESKLEKIYIFDFKMAGTSKEKIANARKLYEELTREIDGRSGAQEEAAIQRLKAIVGVGKCLVYEQDFAKARPQFDKVIADPVSLQDEKLLAQAYTGLGDVIYASVKKELGTGTVKEDQKPEILERLTQAALHYLRVSKFYVESAGDELYPATVGVARVWATMFTIEGEKDCPLAQRAAQFFFAAHKMLPRGETRRLLTREVKLFLEKRDEACAVPAGAGPGVGDDDDDDTGPK